MLLKWHVFWKKKNKNVNFRILTNVEQRGHFSADFKSKYIRMLHGPFENKDMKIKLFENVEIRRFL